MTGGGILLKVTNLSGGYGKAKLLEDLSIEVSKGEALAIIGPNGAGKTTLLRCINGLHKPDAGDIVFNGQSIVNLPVHQVAKLGMTHCPEGRRPFPEMSVKDNLLMGGLGLSKEEVQERLEYVYGLFPILKERESQYVGTMSGGQQQMVAIGRALMTNPTMLLLDEPSVGLAPLVVEEIFDRVNQIKETGVTVLVVEQNVDAVLDVADSIAVLDGGKITFRGSPEELLQDAQLKEAYLGLS